MCISQSSYEELSGFSPEMWHLAKLSVLVGASLCCPCRRTDLSAPFCVSAVAFAQLLRSTGSSASAAAPPFRTNSLSLSQPPATQQHVPHPALPPESGEKGSILTLRCHCCSRWSPPPTSMPAHHTQSWASASQELFSNPKKGKFCLIVQKGIRQQIKGAFWPSAVTDMVYPCTYLLEGMTTPLWHTLSFDERTGAEQTEMMQLHYASATSDVLSAHTKLESIPKNSCLCYSICALYLSWCFN